MDIRSMPWVTGVIAAGALLIAAVGLAPALQLDRGAVASGAFWQLLSCHVTHWSANHLVWDVVALVVLGCWCEARSRTAMVGCLIASAVVIGAGVWVLLPEMMYYRGLSGVDSALFGLLVVMLIGDAMRQGDRRAAVLPVVAMLLFAGKLGYEMTTASAVFVHTDGMVPVPLTHVLGLGCGVATGVTHLWRTAGGVMLWGCGLGHRAIVARP